MFVFGPVLFLSCAVNEVGQLRFGGLCVSLSHLGRHAGVRRAGFPRAVFYGPTLPVLELRLGGICLMSSLSISLY